MKSKGTMITMITGGAILGATIVQQNVMARVMTDNFSWVSAVKWSSVLVAIGGFVYFVANKKLLHLEVIEIGEVGFRTKYGRPVYYFWGARAGEPKTYHPGDRVLVIPIVHDIVVVSHRSRVMTLANVDGTFKGKNISFDLDVEWQILADTDSMFKSAFSLHETVRDDEKLQTLDDKVKNDVLALVDRQLEGLTPDDNGLPDMSGLVLYPEMIRTLENHGPIVSNVRSMKRKIAPEERPKEGLIEAAERFRTEAA